MIQPWYGGTAVLCLACAGALACASPGKYVWADDYADAAPEPEKPYALGAGDVIQVKVFNQDQMSAKARIRPDGKVSLPLLNDVIAAGLTPVALAADLQVRLKDFMKSPLVTVSVEETRPSTVYVAGEVAKPGVYPLELAGGVLQALVNAGGLTPAARDERIFVLRENPRPSRIRFTYEDLVHLNGRAAGFRLRAGDVVVVE
jgi:polysaccharide biosynthesis/export protein